MPIGRLLKSAKTWAKTIKRDIVALWIAARDPRTPVAVKIAAAAVAAYALSPIDLIPDFIPVLGYLDDLVIVPLGIMLAVRLVPEPLMSEFRDLASRQQAKPRSRAGLLAVVFLWAMAAGFAGWYAYRAFAPH
jgi:uncharacterized membrane protein YkvA (DUF1232 family)